MNHDSPNSKKGFYRDPSRGKICGVCVGIADYFGLEIWVVRIIAVTALIFFQFPIFIAYMVAYLVLDAKPGTGQYDKFASLRTKSQRGHPSSISRRADDVAASVQQIWKKGRIPTQTIINIKEKFKSLENRLQSMETYVTSKQYELRKDFEDLST